MLFTLDYILDILCLFFYLSGWFGYISFANNKAKSKDCLMTARNQYLRDWMHALSNREIKIADATLISLLARNVTFFASTSMLIMVGLLSSLAYLEDLNIIIAKVPYAIVASTDMLALKIVLLILAYIYAFFSFTWSIRQYNFSAMMVGSMLPFDERSEQKSRHAENAGRVISLAANSFNYGLRAYYFSLAALAWFIHPLLLIFSTLWVLMVLYRREFKSKTLKAMSNRDPVK